MTTPILDGRYEVGEVIGWGATADVRRGRDLRSGQPVAVKMLREDLVRDPVHRSRFQREAATVAGLRHPAIAAVYDTGHEEVVSGSGGRLRIPIIVMEYVEGRSLRDLLQIRRPTLNEAVQYQVGILSALDFSHRAGVVHRDIKPANVMITPEGTVKVVDFGISRDGGDPTATVTLTRTFLGTPAYVSPEQARGQALDARSDLYSAGCVLYELLAGRPPFVGGDPVSVAYQHVHEQPPRLDTARSGWDDVLATALAKDPGDRFQDACSFRTALLAAARETTQIPHGALGGAFDDDARVALALGACADVPALRC